MKEGMRVKKVRNILFVSFILMVACMIQSQEAHAENVGKYKLSDTNNKYDVTGDGVPDKVEFKKLDQESDDLQFYREFKVIINGKTVLHNHSYFFDHKSFFIQTKGHRYFFISLLGEDCSEPGIIYEYVNGKLKKRVDLEKIAKKVFYIYSVDFTSIKEHSIKVKLEGQANMLAHAKTTFDFNVGAKGKLSLAKKVTKISYSKERFRSGKTKYYKSNYLVAAKKIQVYRSATGTKKAFYIKKGTKLKITKVSVKGKTARFYCVTRSGKKGWVKPKFNTFRDLVYAG